jgi:DNA polymerase V
MSPMFQPNLNNSGGRLDLYDLVTHHKEATFFVKYEGIGLETLGIYNHDILVVDRSIKAKASKIVVLIRDGEFKIEKLSKNENYKIDIWGVITFVIHAL